jgi:hypothetical protein
MQGDVAQHEVGPLALGAVMLLQQCGVDLHVVVQKQKEVSRSHLRSFVAGLRAALIRVVYDDQREGDA